MKKIYNKLIRDKIPEIIISAGEKPNYYCLEKKDFKLALKKKIIEEAKELIKTEKKEDVINELADIEEILFWIKEEYQIRQSEVTKFRKIKNQNRGSFKKRLFLVESIK